jgi:hypothetical protein
VTKASDASETRTRSAVDNSSGINQPYVRAAASVDAMIVYGNVRPSS